jgi:DNA repair exonuclease SbcCD ATPase subunit
MSADEQAPDGVDLEAVMFRRTVVMEGAIVAPLEAATLIDTDISALVRLAREQAERIEELEDERDMARNDVPRFQHQYVNAQAKLDQAEARIATLTTRCEKLAGLVEDGFREAYQDAFSDGLSAGNDISGMGYGDSDPDGCWEHSDTRAELERLTKEETDDK